MKRVSPKIAAVLALLVGVAFVISYSGAGAQAQGGAPSYVFDPSWPKPLPRSGRSAASPASPSIATTTSGC